MNKSDIRKFTMLGTPNHGSATSYYLWEGGDLSVYSFAERKCFFDPLIKSMKTADGCGSWDNYRYIQKKIPSVRRLLPSSTYLIDDEIYDWIPVYIMKWQNDLLPLLDDSKLVKKLHQNIKIFAGTGDQNTISNIRVSVQNPDDPPKTEVLLSMDG